MDQKQQIQELKVPKHIAVIMDGNGRWARKSGEDRSFGHEHGIKSVRETVEGCVEVGVKYLTLYTFSTENWNRPKDEIDALMTILVNSIVAEKPTLHKNKIKLNAIGDLKQLPEHCQQALFDAIEETSEYDNLTLNLALSYSGRWDILNAIKNIAADVKEGNLKTEEITEELLASHLATSSIPDPELMIRTSGEMRISNFLLWQLAYSELYVTDILWPDFRKDDLFEAIRNYQSRERRFGKTSEQLVNGHI